MLEWIRFFITAALLLGGLFILCCGVLGVYRFHYCLNRMHAAAMNDTLGILFALLGCIVSAPDLFTALKLALIIVFFWLASPVASHLLVRLETTTNPHLEKEMEVRR